MTTPRSATIALILCLAAGSAMAQPPMEPGWMGAGPMMTAEAGAPGAPGGEEFPGEPGRLMRFLDRLDLTEDQWDEVQGILDDARDQVEEIREEMRPDAPLEAFLSAFSQPDLTVSDLTSLTDEMDSMRTRIREVALEAIVEVHDVLTSEQLARVARLVDEGLPAGPRRGAGGFGSGFDR